MVIDKTACWLFVLLIRPTLALLDFDVPSNSHPLPFYPWKDISARRYLVRTRPEAPEVTSETPIRYRLDAWSQYDNPEEGKAREGDLKDHPLSRKTTTTDQQLLWPDGIVPYFVDDSIGNIPKKLAILEAAMGSIMEVSCIKFVRIYPDSNGSFPSHTWVNITGSEPGCFADLGRSTFGPSNLNLDVKRCFRTRGHAMHEILHTLGFFHEHMRPDRDDYIQIQWNNIREGDAFNFRMMEDHAVTYYGLPYDYESIMHYSMTAFSKNKSIPTIVPRIYGAEMGQRSHLSVYDVKKLLITYKCNDVDNSYLYRKMNEDRSKDVELLNLKARSSSRVESSNENFVSAVNPLGDHQLLYPTETYEATIPTIWVLPSYDYYYQQYFPNPFVINYFYNFYYYYV